MPTPPHCLSTNTALSMWSFLPFPQSPHFLPQVQTWEASCQSPQQGRPGREMHKQRQLAWVTDPCTANEANDTDQGLQTEIMIFFYWTSSSQTSGVALGRPAAHRRCRLMIIYIYKTIVHQSGMNILEAVDKSNCLCQMGACSGTERVLWLFLGWEVKCSSRWLEYRLPLSLWLGDEGCVSTIWKNPMSCGDWH